MSTENNPEKKLFVDEDWKSQVEAEKEVARHPEQAGKPAAKAPAEERPSAGPRMPIPPATLTFLANTLYLQGTIALGLLPSPVTKKQEFQLDQAKHAIDMLAMLQQKTEGNRTPEESEELDGALHELRLAFIQLQAGGGA